MLAVPFAVASVDSEDVNADDPDVNATKVTEESELFNAIEKSGIINIENDITISDDLTLTIPGDVEVTIEMNGFTISSESKKTGGNRELFLVKGKLSISGPGLIAYKHTGPNMEWNAMSTVFNITAGGVVNLNDVDVINYGGTDMSFAAHLNNWGTASLNVNNCTLAAPYCAIRVFNSGNDLNTVKVKNSQIIAGKTSFWVHNYTEADFGANYNKDAVESRLKIDIDGSNDIVGKFRYGFTNSIYYPQANVIGHDFTPGLEFILPISDDTILTFREGVEIISSISDSDGKTTELNGIITDEG
ncbi:MAG: hypothetical protein IJF47_04675, partial [Candidatus Methanomethylophilaceae archaeon]|nr:hypothetical protein [Candidatus Methanomethylophilaceae archaeon]